MTKIRVYELARELGVGSEEVMAALEEMGEFVRSASSTIEPLVVHELKDRFGNRRQGALNVPAPVGQHARSDPATVPTRVGQDRKSVV